jgi:predicted ATPase
VGEDGRLREGADMAQTALAEHRATGAVLSVPKFMTLLADLHRGAGRIEDGLRVAGEALELARHTGNRYFEADIQRARGDLLLRRAGGAAEAERCFVTGLRLARSRSARSLELRAAIRLAQVQRARDGTAAASRSLGPLCRWFREGADTADLLAARRLLAEMSSRKTPTINRRRGSSP